MKEKRKIGMISDLHLFKRTMNVKRALSKLSGVEMLLIIGDIADRSKENQYDMFLSLIKEQMQEIPVYSVSGNHDNPTRNDTIYREFEQKVNPEYGFILNECGAFYKWIDEDLDLIGLNPLYHQKQFFFPEKGRQLAFLEECLKQSSCTYHIVMCHPPLIAHNPQRTEGMKPYMVFEQDKRLQTIVDEQRHIILISGHTHVAPAVEFDYLHGNLYINAGSICQTTKKEDGGKLQEGNVGLLHIGGEQISVIMKGIVTGKILIDTLVEI